jgi:ATP-dependent Zn protease
MDDDIVFRDYLPVNNLDMSYESVSGIINEKNLLIAEMKSILDEKEIHHQIEIRELMSKVGRRNI